jgi:hypothetical protein
MLSPNQRPGLSSFLFLTGFSTKIFYTDFFSTIQATCPAHLILLDFITRILLAKVDSRL